jgi:hypothetical protein
VPSSKEIRFRKLVEKFGTPEVLTLWADPKKDAAFMSLVKQRRVLTLMQKPTGTKKDFGLIGFHPQPFAAYLVFPKSLPKDDEVIVIGIKYDLLKKTKGRIMGDRTPLKKLEKVKPAPVRKNFEVTIRRRTSVEVKVKVEAFNPAEAKQRALAGIKTENLSVAAEDAENNIISVMAT